MVGWPFFACFLQVPISRFLFVNVTHIHLYVPKEKLALHIGLEKTYVNVFFVVFKISYKGREKCVYIRKTEEYHFKFKAKDKVKANCIIEEVEDFSDKCYCCS